MKKTWTRLLSVLLAVVLTVSILPVSALALDWQEIWDRLNPWTDSTETAEDNANASTLADSESNDFMRIFHLDCGRQYFSAEEIMDLIKLIGEKGYTHMELAIGNDGLRFLLDDMSVTANSTTYESNAVKSGIQTGNKNYRNFGTNELTQSEMDAILSCAKENGISIIPLLNSPGHMDAIIDCMETLKISDPAFSYKSSYYWTYTSARTIDLTNTQAVAFTQALIAKYAAYFAGKGCKYFNLGADEFANDILESYTGMGFGYLVANGMYGNFASYVNDAAAIVKNAGMTPMAFNDGIYYNSSKNGTSFDSDILVCYWSAGYGTYAPASASYLAGEGFRIINTNDGWYYVLGRHNSSQTYNYVSAQSKASSIDCKTATSACVPIGCMQCVWADDSNVTNSDETERIKTLISTFSESNASVFTKPAKSVLAITSSTSEPSLDIGNSMTLTAAEPAEWTVDKEGVVTLTPVALTRAATDSITSESVQVSAVSKGSVVITATGTESGKVGTFALEVSDPNEVLVHPVTVSVNGKTTVTVDGNYPGPYTVSPEGYATVSTTPIPGKNSYGRVDTLAEGTFYVSTQSSVSSKPSAQLTLESAGNGQYYLKNSSGSYIYPDATYSSRRWSYRLATGQQAVSVSITSTGRVQISRSVSSGLNTTTAYLTLSGSPFGASGSASNLYLYKENKDQTTITFHGTKETPDGTTPTVTIGGTQYQITVLPESLSSIDPLKVEFWVTNRHVQKSSTDTTNSVSIAATALGVYSRDGALLSDFVLDKGVNAETNGEVVFWKGTRLTSDNKQTETGGDNKTTSGDDFRYIRYWDGEWAFSADGQTWTSFNDTDQVVAYYLYETTITNEVTTDVVDWGEVPSTGYDSSNFVLLDFAVVRQSNSTRNPVNFPVSGKTQAFHCDPSDTNTVHQYNNGSSSIWYNNYRDLSMVYARPTELYEVYMITVTPTSTKQSTGVATNAQNATSYSYNYFKDGKTNDEKVIWVDDEANLGAFADESTHYTSISGKYKYSVGGDPVVPGVEIFSRHGMLITYYVRSISKTALNVHYRTENTTEDFYNYSISVKDGTVFKSGFNKANPASTGKDSLILTQNSVTSFDGTTEREETVSADLSTMPQIGASYRYRTYTCVRVERSADGKDVYLYYSFEDPTADFIVDFGLPIVIHPEQVESTLRDKANDVTINQQGKYGTVTKNGTDVIYTPNSVLQVEDTFVLQYSGVNSADGKTNQTVAYKITVHPASNVLYEENFLTQEPATGTRKAWTKSEFTHTPNNQATQTLSDTEQVFGNDAAYTDLAESAGFWTVSGLADPSDASTTLSTTFTGTAFDLIGSCGPNTGRIILRILNSENKLVRVAIIDTGYSAGTIDQVPLAHLVLGETDAEYTALIRAYAAPKTSAASTQSMMRMARAASVDALTADLDALDLSECEIEYITMEDVLSTETAASTAVYAAPSPVAVYAADEAVEAAGSSVTIDGFRVYRVTSRSSYSQLPNEHNASYVNILDAVEGQITAYVDDKEIAVDVTEYEAAGGPQNEIYLLPSENRSVQFQVFDADGTPAANTAIQVSLRAVSDATSCNSIPLASTTEMYYTVTSDANGVVTLLNSGSGMLAIGNVKLPEGLSVKGPAEVETNLLRASLLLALDAAKPFEPAAFDAKASSVRLFRSKLVTLRITVSKDVSYVTVNGKTYRPSGLFSRWVKNQTIVVTDSIGRSESKPYEIIAYDTDGRASEPVTVIG